jgi:hypothetical protein
MLYFPQFPGWPGIIFRKAFLDLLPDAFMRPGVIVIAEVLLHDAIQL